MKYTLLFLHLDGLNISWFPLEYFHGFTTLKLLSARENALSIIPPINTLASDLRTLVLNSNRITHVTGVWRENNTVYRQLSYFDLQQNNIISIDAEIMKVLPRIVTFDLRDNSIMHFENPTVYLSRLPRNFNIYLGQNPLDCGPGLGWIASARQVGRRATCAKPACKAGFALREMREYTLYNYMLT